MRIVNFRLYPLTYFPSCISRHETRNVFRLNCLNSGGLHCHHLLLLAHLPLRLLSQRVCSSRRYCNGHVEIYRLDLHLLRNLNAARDYLAGNPYILVPLQLGVCEYAVDFPVGDCGYENWNYGRYRMEVPRRHIWWEYGGQLC